jgi:hypothetical protein
MDFIAWNNRVNKLRGHVTAFKVNKRQVVCTEEKVLHAACDLVAHTLYVQEKYVNVCY